MDTLQKISEAGLDDPPLHEDSHSTLQSNQSQENSQTSKRHYEINIFVGWCKSCGICAAFCPRNCIKIDEDGTPTVADMERCTGCGWCEVHCPDFAISVRPSNTIVPEAEE